METFFSKIDFDKRDVEIRVRIGDGFKFYAEVALLCYYTCQGQSRKATICCAACLHSIVVFI